MGVFDPQYKRLKFFLIIFLFLTLMYTAEAVLLDHEFTYVDSFTGEEIVAVDLDTENESAIREQSEDVGGDLLEVLAFITFARPDVLPEFMILILAPITTILLIVAIYLVIDILYDIIKALPFT